eukprot:scaffold547_cov384-Prasinococcus_capsulatus_cf.AAC.35
MHGSDASDDEFILERAPRTILLAELIALRIDLRQTREERNKLRGKVEHLTSANSSLTRKLELGFQLERKQLEQKRGELLLAEGDSQNEASPAKARSLDGGIPSRSIDLAGEEHVRIGILETLETHLDILVRELYELGEMSTADEGYMQRVMSINKIYWQARSSRRAVMLRVKHALELSERIRALWQGQAALKHSSVALQQACDDSIATLGTV